MNIHKNEVYLPSEDTLLLDYAVRKYKFNMVLEIGTGSGIVSLELSKRNNVVVAIDVDINIILRLQESCKYIHNMNLICCDSASPFVDGVFDMIVFNPPYLPSDEIIDIAVDGGQKGIEVTKYWFKEASRCIKESGVILFVTSSFSDNIELFEFIKNLGYEIRILERNNLFFETLFVVEVRYDN